MFEALGPVSGSIDGVQVSSGRRRVLQDPDLSHRKPPSFEFSTDVVVRTYTAYARRGFVVDN